MNQPVVSPELQSKLATFMDYLLQSLQGSAEFVKEQAPDVAQQWIAWGFWSSAAHVGFGILLSVTLGIVARCVWVSRCKTAVKYKTEYEVSWKSGRHLSEPEWIDLGAILTGVLVVGAIGVMFGFVVAHAPTMVKCKVAPKVYLLESIREFVR